MAIDDNAASRNAVLGRVRSALRKHGPDAEARAAAKAYLAARRQGPRPALAGGLALALIMIPLILRTTEEVILLVPVGYREAALALGIARWKTILHIVVKTASRGIITGILLALARIGGETAPLLFTAFGNRFWNHNLGEPIAALPLQIFTYAISPYEDWHRQAWAGALVLVTGVFCVNVVVRIVTRVRTASA